MDFKKILFKTNEVDVEKSLPDGVILCSKEGKIQWVNDKAAEMFETSKMHLLTSDISDFIENIFSLIQMASSSDKDVIVKMQGRELYFSMTAKSFEEGFVMDFRDLTETKNVDNKFTEIQSKTFDSNVPLILKLENDFKSPLQSIVGFSQAMADGLGGTMSEQQEKYIRIIKKNSSELMYFTDKLMEMYKTESGVIKPELKIFDIHNLVNSTVRYNENLYSDKNLKWSVSIPDGMKNTVVSDEKILKNILQDILEVILKSVDMGDITINISVPDEEMLNSKSLAGSNYFMINIASSSMLLSEGDLELMFDPYKIVDSANRKNLLRAITLLTVKNLVQILKGNVWVESRILKNTSFNIIIPNGIIA